MSRLGGGIISVASGATSSAAKGESIGDTALTVSQYADVIVMRHPQIGSAVEAAEVATVPVINAGDGAGQHPTQALLDVYTIQKEIGSLDGIQVSLVGDLKYGRTTHSLIFALAKFGADILFCPSPGLEVPEHVISKLVTEYGGELESYGSLDQTAKDNLFPMDAVYTTPSSHHQLAMLPDISLQLELKSGVDALYVTRPQKERFASSEEKEEAGRYRVVDKKLLKDKAFRKSIVMHPLPRVDELAYELDADPRSMYFKQAARGVPIRMALIALLLGARELPASERKASLARKIDYPVYNRGYGVRCPNPTCVSIQESETKYLTPEFKIVSRRPLVLRCIYCEHGHEPGYVASSDWHQGMLESKKYHRADSHLARKIKPENLIIFDSKSEAEAHGFKPSHYARRGLDIICYS